MPLSPKLVLLGRPGCHLCDEFEEELRAHVGAALDLEHADVDSRREWRDEFGRRVPVLLTAQGELVCETRFDAAALASYLT